MWSKALVVTGILFCWFSNRLAAQSLELMPGHRRIFADLQWLKPLGTGGRWTVFSRTRATVDYEQQTDLFSGAYLNVTTTSGWGVSLVGKISSSSAGGDAGLHIFRSDKRWMLFGLASAGLKTRLEYSWFSILRFTPALSERWKLYTGLELFSLFGKSGHLFSVQRLRLGLERKGYQFGLAGNLSEVGRSFLLDNNFGIFIRKSF